MRLRQRKSHQTPTTQIPSKPSTYPSGIAVRTENAHYYIHSDGKRYRIPTKRILESWNYPLVVDSSETALKNYPIALAKIGFRDGTLLNNFADGKLYLVSAGKLRQVTDPEVFERLGVNHLMAIVVSDAEINLMKVGAPIT